MRSHRDINEALAAGPLSTTGMRPAHMRRSTFSPWRMARALGAWLWRGVLWLSWRRHVAALQGLDDATLKDIGVLRDNIESYVAQHHAIASMSRSRPREDPWVNGD
jgi:uncharacterized protein YjiS (DUF1127 family)